MIAADMVCCNTGELSPTPRFFGYFSVAPGVELLLFVAESSVWLLVLLIAIAHFSLVTGRRGRPEGDVLLRRS